MFLFADLPTDPRDFEILPYYFTAHPGSYFVTQRIVKLSTPTGSLTLTNRTFTKREQGTVLRQELKSEEAVLPVLPTVPFFLLAAVCFTRSSRKLRIIHIIRHKIRNFFNHSFPLRLPLTRNLCWGKLGGKEAVWTASSGRREL